jgi:hypothetical protein
MDWLDNYDDNVIHDTEKKSTDNTSNQLPPSTIVKNKVQSPKKRPLNYEYPFDTFFEEETTKKVKVQDKRNIDFKKRSIESNIKINHEKKTADEFNEFKKYGDDDGNDSDDAVQKKKSHKKVFKELSRHKMKTKKQKQNNAERYQKVKTISKTLEDLSTIDDKMGDQNDDTFANNKAWNGILQEEVNETSLPETIEKEDVESKMDTEESKTEDIVIENYTGIETTPNDSMKKNNKFLNDLITNDKKKPMSEQQLFYFTGNDMFDEAAVLIFEKNKPDENNDINNQKEEETIHTDNTDINNNAKHKDDYNILNSTATLKKNNEEKVQNTVGLQKLVSTPKQKTNSNRNQVFKISGLSESYPEHVADFELYSRDTNHFIGDQQAIMRRVLARSLMNNVSEHRTMDMKMISRVEGNTREEEEEYLRIPRPGENQCMKDNECEGMKIGKNTQPVINVEYIDYKEREQRKLNKNKTYPRRPCIMCIRSSILYFFSAIKAPCAPLDVSICISAYYNFTDKPGEYCSSQCIAGNGSYWQGLPGPIVAHDRRYYEQIIVDGEYRWLQSGYKRPVDQGVGTTSLHFFQ